jgi:NAD(P)-dependent dehydrogenase (short-subunit alcohol dehydrogenase family)
MGPRMKLKGKTAIVTGAGRGIGKMIATRLATGGANVVIADIQHHEESAAAIATATGARTLGMRIDVSSEVDTTRMAAEALAKFGSIDILVNNAALFANLELRPFEQIPVDEWKRLMEINIMGVALCCKAVSPQMRKQKWGRIVNLASGAPLKGVPLFLHYIASKGAVISMTRGLAREFGADGITVNALAPGFTLSEGVLAHPQHLQSNQDIAVRTRAIPRQEQPEDLVGTVSFLASDDAAFMTGQTLVVDGGSAMV